MSFRSLIPMIALALAAPQKLAAQTVSELPAVAAKRLGDSPVIYPEMPGLEGELGENIDGPVVIRVPDWIENPLGRYYMYFAHHRGTFIRLAFADRPEGPWTVYQPGTLRLEQTSALHHIASPAILVDDKSRRMLMYYHGPVETPGLDYGGRPYRQRSFLAQSSDGLNFTPLADDIAPPYMKTFAYRGAVYGLAMADKESAYPDWLRSGQFLRSADGKPPFEPGPRILDEMRHAGLFRRGDTLHVFYTSVGDRPERIMHVAVDLRPDWREWTASAPSELLRPEYDYEGASLPVEKSQGGMSYGAENALRDPGVLDDGDQAYLYYSVAGEQGIAVAKLTFAGD